jgi:hypothetical protein
VKTILAVFVSVLFAGPSAASPYVDWLRCLAIAHDDRDACLSTCGGGTPCEVSQCVFQCGEALEGDLYACDQANPGFGPALPGEGTPLGPWIGWGCYQQRHECRGAARPECSAEDLAICDEEDGICLLCLIGSCP